MMRRTKYRAAYMVVIGGLGFYLWQEHSAGRTPEPVPLGMWIAACLGFAYEIIIANFRGPKRPRNPYIVQPRKPKKKRRKRKPPPLVTVAQMELSPATVAMSPKLGQFLKEGERAIQAENENDPS